MHQKLLYLTKKSPLLLIFSIIFFEFGSIFLIFQTRLVAKFINEVIFLGIPLNQFTKLISIVLLLIILRGLSNFGGEIFAKRVALKIKKYLRKELTDSRIQKNISSNLHSGAISVIFYDQVESIEAYFSQFIPQIFLSILIPASILIFVFPLDKITGLVFLITAPLIPFFMVLIGKFSEKTNVKQWKSLSELSIFFLDSIRGLRTLISFQQSKKHLERIKNANQDYVNNSLVVLRITFLSALVLELLSTVAIAVVAVEIGLRLLYFRISFEQAFFILLIAPEFYLPLRNLGLRFHAALNGVTAFQTIYGLIQSQKIHPIKSGVSESIENIKELTISELSFQYPQADKPLINDFTFTFEKGNHYALVGPNGVGKSTLFKLILKFLEPTSGKILINDREINQFSQKDYFAHFSWLPQNPAIFQGTILDNLRIANSNVSLEDITTILEKLKLMDFVNGLPDGLQTKVQEFGTTISTGQKQRIGLARVLYRNSSVILCDEPTSASDPIFENTILEQFSKLKKDKIIISIAHRFQTVKDADQILFLEMNQRIKFGSLKDLYSNEINFRRFFDLYSGGVFE